MMGWADEIHARYQQEAQDVEASNERLLEDIEYIRGKLVRPSLPTIRNRL